MEIGAEMIGTGLIGPPMIIGIGLIGLNGPIVIGPASIGESVIVSTGPIVATLKSFESDCGLACTKTATVDYK